MRAHCDSVRAIFDSTCCLAAVVFSVLLRGAMMVLAPSLGCAPQEAHHSTTNAAPDLERGDTSLGVALVSDDATALADETATLDLASSPEADLVRENDVGTDAPIDPPPPGAVVRPVDAEPAGACTPSLGPGDLVIDELMIQSVAGTGDYGEWFEVRSERNCALNLRGLHGDATSGAKVRTFDIVADSWLAAQGMFVVADSTNTALNHDIPGIVVAWGGRSGDVLRNKGGTVTLRMNDLIIDSLTFPAIAPMIGASLSFPSNCPASRRSDWSAWQFSMASWFPGFLGTPNAPNVDVLCP